MIDAKIAILDAVSSVQAADNIVYLSTRKFGKPVDEESVKSFPVDQLSGLIESESSDLPEKVSI